MTTSRDRRARWPLLACLGLLLGAAGFPGPMNVVEVVDTSQPLIFNCILHQKGLVAPGVGVTASQLAAYTAANAPHR
jgi:hypothetical protein